MLAVNFFPWRNRLLLRKVLILLCESFLLFLLIIGLIVSSSYQTKKEIKQQWHAKEVLNQQLMKINQQINHQQNVSEHLHVMIEKFDELASLHCKFVQLNVFF